jgi:hypothetical protein
VQKSILNESRETLYFANSGVHDIYKQFTDKIKDYDCDDLGIMLLGDDPEYLLWVLMGAPRTSMRIEWVISGPTARYSPPNFKPCAIICHSCTMQQTTLRGLEIAQQSGDIWLYLAPEK